MRRSHTIVGFLTTVLAGLILVSGTPAGATHPVAQSRIADVDSRTFATASTTTRLVTMQLPSAAVGPQNWVFSDTTLGTQVRNVATGGCLTIPTAWTTIYPPIIQQPCEGKRTEYWRIVSTTTGTVMFGNLGRDGCMGIDPTGTALPARLFLYPCNAGARNQHFRLVA